MFAGYAQHLLAAPGSFRNVKSMTVFQDRNECFNAVSRLHREELPRSHQANVVTPPVIPSRQPVVAWEFATASLCLEHLSISFMIDAADFFDRYREKWLWCELRSLTLTSQLLTCNGDSFKISGLLKTAAQMATRMPKLERLTTWNGGVNKACAFKYHKHQHNASVTWQAKGVHSYTRQCTALEKTCILDAFSVSKVRALGLLFCLTPLPSRVWGWSMW
jgi:hypothetical protein